MYFSCRYDVDDEDVWFLREPSYKNINVSVPDVFENTQLFEAKDNGPEYASAELMSWAAAQDIRLLFIQPGKPTQNAYIERFNHTARHEWLDLHLFESIERAQELATEWMWSYNHERPHSALGGITPQMKLEAA